MRKCGVLGSCIIFMCIRVYIEERKKHKSPYRPYFMLTSSLVPPYPNLSRLPRALFAGTPLHMFCALFSFCFPMCSTRKEVGYYYYLWVFFLSFCSFVPPSTHTLYFRLYQHLSYPICSVDCFLILIHKYEKSDNPKP
jgi:hypothetical protein